MTKTHKEYIELIAKWYYLTPKQLEAFTGKALKTIDNQLRTMLANGVVKRLKQPYTNEYVYAPTYKGYRLSNLTHWREKNINLYSFNHTKAIIDYVLKNNITDYQTERELISELYKDGKPETKRTPDLVVKKVAYEFEITFKSNPRYKEITSKMDNQLSNKTYSKFVWVCAPKILPKIKELILSNTLEDSKHYQFKELINEQSI